MRKEFGSFYHEMSFKSNKTVLLMNTVFCDHKKIQKTPPFRSSLIRMPWISLGLLPKKRSTIAIRMFSINIWVAKRGDRERTPGS